MKDLIKKIHETNEELGWKENIPELGTQLMLVVSEISEALEADRKGRRANLGGLQEGESWKESFQENIKDTLEDELADSIIRLLDICDNLGIDIEKHIDLKLRYNSMRGYKHGKKY